MKWGWEDFVPANPDLADIWGDMDLSFENDYFVFAWVPNFQIQGPDFQKSGLGQALAGPGVIVLGDDVK